MTAHSNSLRRRLLAGGAGALATAGLGALPGRALAQAATIDMPFANGTRRIAAFPEKRPLIVLTTRPPQLETPFEVFNDGLLTPNDAFFVRYHQSAIPTSIDADKHVIKVGGTAVGKPFEITVPQLKKEFKPGARQVVYHGLDTSFFGGGNFVKSIDVGHALDGDVMIAWQMNGADLPFLNGFPVKMIVPGYYGTYWVKHLSDIQVVDQVFEGFWMKPAYRVPDNDCTCVAPGTAMTATRPIGRLNVRSFITSLKDGARIPAGATTTVRGIAFDGGQGVREVAYSTDGGKVWREAKLGEDLGRYSFREFTFAFAPDKGNHDLCVRAWNRSGQSQPMEALWQPTGYMRNVVEHMPVVAA